MPATSRVLDPEPVPSLDRWLAQGGGDGLRVALDEGPEATLAVVEASGLRGRGGAGFPTGLKWRTVLEHAVGDEIVSVVVNAAEGEPGCFKDRLLLERNPYRVLEGALIAASVARAREVVVATKGAFGHVVERLRQAVEEVTAAGWTEGISLRVVEGPSSYLFGEETALLEVVDGREPFPRLAPPWRRGLDHHGRGGALAGDAELADAADDEAIPPALVSNTETMANLPGLVAHGPDWFRELGTEQSPGTVIVTVSGHVERAGVVEVPLGTPLREVIDLVGGGTADGDIRAVLSGVANPVLAGDQLDVPLTYEDLSAIGSGLGAAGFVVYDERSDPVEIARGVARFLAVESCGQCTPCKQDGLAIADALDHLCRPGAHADHLVTLRQRLGTVAEGARCALARQQETVIGSLLERFPEDFERHARDELDPEARAEPVAAIEGIDREVAVLDEAQFTKQPDWTHDAEDSGRSPADRLDQRSGEAFREE